MRNLFVFGTLLVASCPALAQVFSISTDLAPYKPSPSYLTTGYSLRGSLDVDPVAGTAAFDGTVSIASGFYTAAYYKTISVLTPGHFPYPDVTTTYSSVLDVKWTYSDGAVTFSTDPQVPSRLPSPPNSYRINLPAAAAITLNVSVEYTLREEGSVVDSGTVGYSVTGVPPLMTLNVTDYPNSIAASLPNTTLYPPSGAALDVTTPHGAHFQIGNQGLTTGGVVPEPREYAIIAATMLFAFAAVRRRREVTAP